MSKKGGATRPEPAGRQVERVLRHLHEGTSATTGEAYLKALVRSTAGALGAGWSFIGLLAPDPPRRVRTVALWKGDRFVDDLEYALAGTPCEQVASGQAVQFKSGVAGLFPNDPLLVGAKIQGYMGVPIPGADGRPRGLLGAFCERPMPLVRELGPLFGTFAARAAAELDRLEAQRNLGESEARFRLIVTSCVEGVCVVGPGHLIRYANPQLASMLGVTSAEALIGRSYRDFTRPEVQAVLDERIRSRATRWTDRYEAGLRTADGRDIHVDISAALVPGPDGRLDTTIALFRDVTEQRALDDQVREAQKLESLGVLAGGLAHEFNNLLVGILANSSYVASELPEGTEPRAAMEDVRAAATRASELTRQLLAYSGRGKFTVGPVDLNLVATEMLALAAPAMGRLRVERTLAPALPAVQGDAGQLGQVVMNLLTNAADAVGERGGSIAIRTWLALVGEMELAHFHGGQALSHGTFVALEVEDDGPGMDPVTRARVFEPFFSTKFAGRGLGLPAALGILRGHGGAIRLDSEPGRGSRVTIILPVGAQARTGPAQAGAPSRAQPAGPPVVLVADDEEVVRRAARRALERAGFEVVEAVDGQEALARFRAGAASIACVLLDLTMPGMGGEEALAAIRELSPGVPAVLTSGYADRDEASPEATSQRVGFLPKPFGPAELISAVRALLDQA